MKKFKALLAPALIIATINTCQANEISYFRWKGNGTVTNSDKKKIRIDIQSAYRGIEYDNKLYVAGFAVDKEGINTPKVAEVSKNLSGIRYWTFENSIKDLFIYKNSMYTNDSNGGVFRLNSGNWEKSELSFPENTRIIFTDKAEKLIACHPAPMQKEAPNRDGGCFSLNPAWHSHFVWFVDTPKLCSNFLYVYENKTPKSGLIKALSLETGQVVHEKLVAKPPKDLCSEKFNSRNKIAQ